MYACCDSKRKNKREADIWERKSVTLKYQKFGLNRTENFLICHFKVWDIHLCVGGGCARSCRQFLTNDTFGWGGSYHGILESIDSFIRQTFTGLLPRTITWLCRNFRRRNRRVESFGSSCPGLGCDVRTPGLFSNHNISTPAFWATWQAWDGLAAGIPQKQRVRALHDWPLSICTSFKMI